MTQPRKSPRNSHHGTHTYSKAPHSTGIVRFGRFKSCMLGLHVHCSQTFEYVSGELIIITCDCTCHHPNLDVLNSTPARNVIPIR